MTPPQIFDRELKGRRGGGCWPKIWAFASRPTPESLVRSLNKSKVSDEEEAGRYGRNVFVHH